MNSYYTAEFCARFWSKVDRMGPNGCWLWQAATMDKGYGVVKFRGRLYRSHRIAYELSNGALSNEALVLHACDRPGCVNPAHLRAGTHKENSADMDARGRRRLAGHGAAKRRRPQPKPDVRTRFWSRVAIDPTPKACWMWTASTDANGYGAFSFGGNTKAHRVAYTLSKGPIPNGLVILHSCDNPRCVNPDHLRAGTQRENVADMDARGRRASTAGEKHGRSKLTEPDVLAIRARAADGERADVLASEYGVKRNAIYQIVTRTRWAHLTA